ncbi:hypothetical protein [Hahella ganghwensis]|uniref:hypothetical protein n=1 Tax=Hahella ganghwensis TaxID=286420 RepID=UPI001B7FD39F|nr:hypothetical protein [Hahella ganghwensis]
MAQIDCGSRSTGFGPFYPGLTDVAGIDAVTVTLRADVRCAEAQKVDDFLVTVGQAAAG